MFTAIPSQLDRVLVVVIPMDYQAMITAPSLVSATEILRSYHHGGQLVIDLTKWLRAQGYQAIPHHPMGDRNEYHQLLLPPHAVTAGLGEQGRTRLFIDYNYGSLVRLTAISTDTPLELTTSAPRGITEFCHRCRYCITYCPPRALPDATYLQQVITHQPLQFRINAHRCFQYFEQHHGCGRCLVHCILAGPDRDDISKRLDRITNWYTKWVVSGKLEDLYQQEMSQLPTKA